MQQQKVQMKNREQQMKLLRNDRSHSRSSNNSSRLESALETEQTMLYEDMKNYNHSKLSTGSVKIKHESMQQRLSSAGKPLTYEITKQNYPKHHSIFDDQKVPCSNCDEKFKDHVTMWTHRGEVHPQPPPYRAPFDPNNPKRNEQKYIRQPPSFSKDSMNIVKQASGSGSKSQNSQDFSSHLKDKIHYYSNKRSGIGVINASPKHTRSLTANSSYFAQNERSSSSGQWKVQASQSLIGKQLQQKSESQSVGSSPPLKDNALGDNKKYEPKFHKNSGSEVPQGTRIMRCESSPEDKEPPPP